MPRLVECIPNFSEGRNREVLGALEKAAQGVKGVTLLDVHSDESHNRSVFTLLGSPEGIEEAAFRLARTATENIDMRTHRGEHPRMGATDVIPFVPLTGTTLDECIRISRSVAKRVWEVLGVPVILYEGSATAPHRRNLADVRRGQFEGMSEKLLEEKWAPDFGDRKIHPTAGITAIGARMPLVAFNVNLETGNIGIAKNIAKAIRGSSGGYRDCKALGIMLGGRGIAQVSMNIVDYEGTPLYRVFEAIRFEAARYGVGIIGAELVGLTPAKALLDTAAYYLKMENYDPFRQVLEYHLIKED